MKKPPAPKMFKSVFQARYKPHLRFYDLLMGAAGKFTEYPHWRTNRLDVTLRNPDRRHSLAIKHESFGYTQDSGDLTLEAECVKHIVDDLPSALELDSFTRLGFLRRYLLPVDMSFEELTSVMIVKLYSQDSRLLKILPPKLEDFMYRLDSADEDHRYHITAGPVRKMQIPQLLSFNQDDHLASESAVETIRSIESKYPDVAIFFDIDFYRDGEIPVAEAQEFIETGRSTVDQLVSNLGEYILSTKVEA